MATKAEESYETQKRNKSKEDRMRQKRKTKKKPCGKKDIDTADEAIAVQLDKNRKKKENSPHKKKRRIKDEAWNSQ